MKKPVSVLLILAALFLAASPLSVTASASAGELTLDEATNIIRNGWQFYLYFECDSFYRNVSYTPRDENTIKVRVGDNDRTYYRIGKDGYFTPDDYKNEMLRYFIPSIAEKSVVNCPACQRIPHPMFYEKDGVYYKTYCGLNYYDLPVGWVWNTYDLKIDGDRATVNAVMSSSSYIDDPDHDFVLEIVLRRTDSGGRMSDEGDIWQLVSGELKPKEYNLSHPAPKVSHDTDKFTYTEACDLARRGGSFYSWLQFNGGLTDETKYFNIEGVELMFGRIPYERKNMPYSNAEEALEMTKQYFTDEIAEGSVTYCLAELRPDSYPYEQGVKKCPLFYVYEGVTYKYIGGWQSQYNPGEIHYPSNFRCDGNTATMDVTLSVAGGSLISQYFTTSITFVKTPNGWRIGDSDYTKLAMSKIDRFEYYKAHTVDDLAPPTGDGAGIKIFALSALALASVAVLVRALPRRRKYDEV